MHCWVEWVKTWRARILLSWSLLIFYSVRGHDTPKVECNVRSKSVKYRNVSTKMSDKLGEKHEQFLTTWEWYFLHICISLLHAFYRVVQGRRDKVLLKTFSNPTSYKVDYITLVQNCVSVGFTCEYLRIFRFCRLVNCVIILAIGWKFKFLLKQRHESWFEQSTEWGWYSDDKIRLTPKVRIR